MGFAKISLSVLLMLNLESNIFLVRITVHIVANLRSTALMNHFLKDRENG